MCTRTAAISRELGESSTTKLKRYTTSRPAGGLKASLRIRGGEGSRESPHGGADERYVTGRESAADILLPLKKFKKKTTTTTTAKGLYSCDTIFGQDLDGGREG